jgi:translocation protein SEC63
MTDEKARDNFLKYGNPDGRGSMAVGIALPNFLQKKEYQLQVLIIFFVIIVFMIPYYFYSRISEGEKDVGGVNVENRKIFTDLINENMLGKHIPAFFAQSAEFCTENKKMKVRGKNELETLTRIKNHPEVKESIPKQKEGKPPVNVKPICLLMGYMYDLFTPEEQKDEELQKDLELILRAVPSYIDIMLFQTM